LEKVHVLFSVGVELIGARLGLGFLIEDGLGSVGGSSEFSGLYSFFESFLVVVDDRVDFFGDVLLATLFLEHEFF
jgi:hypothetical protein